LSFKPYAIGGLTDHLAQEKPLLLNAGLDTKYGIGPNLTLDLTVNTDFAQVEADREEVNLTRFSLYFPEKREFFLEGSGRFTFGADGGEMAPPLNLFYSRQIGLYQGHKVPILGGGKMTGKVGSYSLGLLNLTTAKTEFSSVASTSNENAQPDNSVPMEDQWPGGGKSGGTTISIRTGLASGTSLVQRLAALDNLLSGYRPRLHFGSRLCAAERHPCL